jgi:hypothetical protein
MKIKLLKKIRKRFTITHFPKGIRMGSDFYDYNLFRLTDKENEYWRVYCELNTPQEDTEKIKLKFGANSADTERECINLLLEKMLIEIRGEHPRLGFRGHQRIPRKKVWYNIN